MTLRFDPRHADRITRPRPDMAVQFDDAKDLPKAQQEARAIVDGVALVGKGVVAATPPGNR